MDARIMDIMPSPTSDVASDAVSTFAARADERDHPSNEAERNASLLHAAMCNRTHFVAEDMPSRRPISLHCMWDHEARAENPWSGAEHQMWMWRSRNLAAALASTTIDSMTALTWAIKQAC